MQKNFIVNNNKIIRAWSLSSKWPVCRSVVNRPLEEQAEQKWLPCLKQICLNTVPRFAIKWLKCICNKAILSIQIMDKSIFVLFWDFSPCNWRAKLVIYLLLLSILSHQKVALVYLRSWNLLFNLGSIKHTYISVVKQTITTL